MTNKEFLDNFDAGCWFSDEELNEIRWGELPDDRNEIETQEGCEHRWQKEMTTIFEVDGRFFSLDWMRGLTERQENDYYNQPCEVTRHTYEKTITVTEWKPIEADA